MNAANANVKPPREVGGVGSMTTQTQTIPQGDTVRKFLLSICFIVCDDQYDPRPEDTGVELLHRVEDEGGL